MLCVCYVNIVFSLYSVFVVLLNVNPIATLKGLDLARSVRHNGRKKDTHVVDKAIGFADTEDEVLAESGETVTLRCAVKNLENDIVSWIRCKNLRVITSGSIVFTADRRFQLNYSTDNEFEWWNLTISNVQSNDSGIYECQINTEPKLKRFVLLIVNSEYEVEELQRINEISTLNNDSPQRDTDDWETVCKLTVVKQELVLELMILKTPTNFRTVTTNILGPAERFVSVGDTITLTCNISFKENYDPVIDAHISLPQQDGQSTLYGRSFFRKVHWFHSFNLISKWSGRHMNINTKNCTPFLTVSRLTVSHVQRHDAGLYLCKPIGGPASKVVLNVIKGEETEAVKSENYLQFNNARRSVVVTTAKYKRLFLWFYITLFAGIHFPT